MINYNFKHKVLRGIAAVFILFTFCVSCAQDFLEMKPNKALLVPTTLEEFEAILHNESLTVMSTPALGLLSSDDVYLPDNIVNGTSINVVEKNVYLWRKDLFENNKYIADWKSPYQTIFYANVVLEGLSALKVDVNNAARWNRAYGSALFYRGMSHYLLAINFCSNYAEDIADDLYGIPLKLSADINDRPKRGTLKQTYNQIIEDLMTSIDYLPEGSDRKSQPDKTAAYAMLARVLLSMQHYNQSFTYADKALKNNAALINYNKLDAKLAKPIPSPFPQNENREVILFSQMQSWGFRSNVFVEPALYNLYSSSDLRKKFFFQSRANDLYSFIGTYNGTVSLFSGITTAEMLLTRAETAYHLKDLSQSKADLQRLYDNRYISGNVPQTNDIANEELLAKILDERRRELLFRGLRWGDLKRLNKDERTAVEIKRFYEGELIKLVPNSPLYVFPIPQSIELDYNDLPQNIR